MARLKLRRYGALVLLGWNAVGATEVEWRIPEPWRLAPPLVIVLSGGGARGIAQLGVLEVLEQHGWVPDGIVGTSIGAILGGLYASGYTVQELQEIVWRTNWEELLSLREHERAQLFVDQRQEEDRSLLTLSFDAFRPVLPLALSPGTRMTAYLQELVWGAPYRSSDFDQLWCRFRAVATDLLRGRAVVLRRGDLAMALRASAVFPLRYVPVRWDSLLLVDGGLEANLPVRLARQEFPEAVIVAVNTTAPLRTEAQLTTPWAIADQSISLVMQRFIEQDRAAADVLIEPALGHHGTLEFRDFATLIARGREAAVAALPQLQQRYRMFWDSLAQVYAQRFGAGYAARVAEIRWSGFTAEEEEALEHLRSRTLPEALSGILWLSARGGYRQLVVRAGWDGRGIVLSCHVEPYPECRALELWGMPAGVAELLARMAAVGERCRTGGPAQRRLEWRLRRALKALDLDTLVPRTWSVADSCLYAWLEREHVWRVECSGVSPQECRDVQEFLTLEEGRPIMWQRFWPRWQGLQHSGLFRSLEAYREQDGERVTFRLRLSRVPPQQVHFGLRTDNERYTRLWLEAVHRQGVIPQMEVRAAGIVGPRDGAVSLQVALQRRSADIGAAVQARLYASSRLVRLFERRPTSTGWEVITTGDARQQRYGIRLGLRLPFQPVDVIEGWLSYERQREAPEGQAVPFATILLWGTAFGHDSRDRTEFPRQGRLARLSFEGALPRWFEATVGFTRLEVAFGRSYRVWWGHSLWTELHFAAGDIAMPQIEFFSLGGLRSFWALREDELVGRQLVRLSALYQLPVPPILGLPSSLALRYDVGGVWIAPQQIRLGSLQHGVGLGVCVETPLGLAVATLARGFEFSRGVPALRWGPTVVAFMLGSALP
ncbi:MAG: patatin-like phospholipase family protein [Candidatus Kapabacteria bacterium]|nr:patatin-like phospholipase family protein [Candidatus Kapabacteria bacterium]MDW8011842.1 patatin-like phospholipase family protein [Bacteroidota bacterium]